MKLKPYWYICGMDIKKYYKQLKADQKKQLADDIGTSLNYLRHIFNGRRKASPKMAKRIEEATRHEVTREDLRPDFYE